MEQAKENKGMVQAPAAPSAPSAPPIKRDWLGRVIGLLVFAVGLTMLGYVFMTALHLFNTPLSSWLGPPTSAMPNLSSLANVGVGVTIKILFLALMTFIGSIVTNRGIQMYFTAAGVKH